MPELPEVETIAQKLHPELVGHRVSDVRVFWPRIVDRPDLDSFRTGLVGATFTHIDRRGKFLLISLDTGWVLLVHLRMSGHFELTDAAQSLDDIGHIRLVLKFAGGKQLVYIDPRKFGRFYLVENAEEVVGALGPEPLAPDFTAEVLCRRLTGRRGEIKRLLLDQRFVAGLGNIYANEILWHARIHPQRVAGALSEAACHRLYTAMVHVLRQGIRHGGTSLEDRQYVYPDGRLGEHQEHLNVYDRAGESCPRCGAIVERIVQGQRSTYYCPACQPRYPEDREPGEGQHRQTEGSLRD